MGKSHPEAHDKNRITTESIPNERGGLQRGRPFLCFDIRVRGGIPRQNGFDGIFLSIKPLSIWKTATFLLLFADHYLFLFVAQKFVQEGRSQYQHASRQLHG